MFHVVEQQERRLQGERLYYLVERLTVRLSRQPKRIPNGVCDLPRGGKRRQGDKPGAARESRRGAARCFHGKSRFTGTGRACQRYKPPETVLCLGPQKAQ